MYATANTRLWAEMAQVARTVLRAYLECSDELQDAVRDMIEIIESPKSDENECSMAIHTLMEILFPQRPDASVPLEEFDALAIENKQDGKDAIEAIEAEEQSFADALRAAMDASDLSQTELAERAGVSQPAISLMLKRHCRPQRRTIRKLAQALGISPDELWQGY